MNPAKTQPSKTPLTLAELLIQKSMQLGQLVASAGDSELAVVSAKTLSESFFLDRAVALLVDLKKLLLGLAGLYSWRSPMACRNEVQLIGGSSALLVRRDRSLDISKSTLFFSAL